MPLFPLTGHEALRARLDQQVARGSLPSSLLLHGPSGVGKQQLALWLGRRMLCTGAAPPCGECQHCRYALGGVHPDLRWYFPQPRLKEAGDISLEEVAHGAADAIAERIAARGLYARADGSHGIFVHVSRLIVQQAVITPAMASRKVFVVGDAERMVPQASSPEAANAFLKLLEEPLPDTTIILTSSEPGALLATIRSRVVAIRVAPLPDDGVRAFLADPAAAEAAGANETGVTMDDLLRLAHGAPGTLLGGSDRGVILARARRLLDAAGAGRAEALRASFAQGSVSARGAFSDVLDAMTVLLHERVRDAVRKGDTQGATASARAVQLVEDAKRSAEGNAIPALVSVELLTAIGG